MHVPDIFSIYHRCNKAYEAIEFGNPLDALADLSGAICEHFILDEMSRDRLFHTLYKSSLNRSLIICWRNEKRVGFRVKTNNKALRRAWEKEV